MAGTATRQDGTLIERATVQLVVCEDNSQVKITGKDGEAKNTGDDRRRTHDMNTANWIPDLFMKRVFDDGKWTLFSPSEVPDLHDLTGKAFEERYEYYEALTEYGKLKLHKTIKAKDLWRKMLSMLFETGHPWITFKDPCNIRSPQQHVGVVHSSNLCTEITLNTNKDEIAVCNLGSVNLAQHLKDGGIDHDKLNVSGGAIALGHPFGMTGARITASLINNLQAEDKQFGVETMCVGGGQGMAMVIERLS